jgi:HEAT repeat protein
MALLVIAAAIAFKAIQSSPTPPPAPPAAAAPSSVPGPRPASRPAPSRDDAGAPSEATPAPTPKPSAPAPSPPPEFARVDPRDLVSILAALTGKDPISPEQAQKWKESLQQLIRQGPSSVPAIQQFLAQNQDVNFVGISGAGALGYNTLRSAMVDALGQIGGADATQAMLQVLQTSIFPTDIPALANALNAQAPGQYQEAVLDAVRQQLNLGAMDQLGGANVLPLFQALATEAANGASLTADLTQYAEKWPYYSAIALAAMPDGAGVSSLIQIAQGTVPGNSAAAAQALAELAPQNTEALNTLLDLAKNGQLSDSVLSQLAPYLAGRQLELGPPANPAAGGYLTFHMANGNEDFSAYDAGGTMTQSQIAQDISVIDKLLQAVPSTDSATVDALQQQRSALAARQKK